MKKELGVIAVNELRHQTATIRNDYEQVRAARKRLEARAAAILRLGNRLSAEVAKAEAPPVPVWGGPRQLFVPPTPSPIARALVGLSGGKSAYRIARRALTAPPPTEAPTEAVPAPPASPPATTEA